MQRVRAQLGVTDLFQESMTGPAVVTGVLDSGVALHPDLKRKILAFRDFTGRKEKNGKRYLMHMPYDDYGHGTHVCGILCGDGRMSAGRYRGIFPQGLLVVGRVLDEKGNGSADDMLEGMAWILEQKRNYDIRLLNISVGISELKDTSKMDRLRRMMRTLTEHGILVVCAAGNRGPASGTVSALGEMEQVVSVGCHDGAFYRGDPGRCATYSGCGRLHGVPRKPDVVAPGTRIISCNAFWQKPGEDSYTVRSGTSMATPIVTGSLAGALQCNPYLTPMELKNILTRTARNLGDPWNRQGWGMIQPREIIKVAKQTEKKQ